MRKTEICLVVFAVKPVKFVDWLFQGGTAFVDHLCYLCLVFVMLWRLFIAALWSPVRKRLTSWLLFVMSNCDFVTFPCGILGQLWYLILLSSDLCRLSYFVMWHAFFIYTHLCTENSLSIQLWPLIAIFFCVVWFGSLLFGLHCLHIFISMSPCIWSDINEDPVLCCSISLFSLKRTLGLYWWVQKIASNWTYMYSLLNSLNEYLAFLS